MFRHPNTLEELDEIIPYKYRFLSSMSESWPNRKNQTLNMLKGHSHYYWIIFWNNLNVSRGSKRDKLSFTTKERIQTHVDVNSSDRKKLSAFYLDNDYGTE